MERVSLPQWRVLCLSISNYGSFLVLQEGTKEEKAGSHSSTTVVTPVVEPVVSTPIDVKSHTENETNDHENDAEKDETQTKDIDLSSVLSDSESVRGGGRGEHGGNISLKYISQINFI
jgi:hypothetical protein